MKTSFWLSVGTHCAPAFVMFCLLAATAGRAADTLTVAPDRESAVYKRGETITFTVTVSSNGAPLAGRTVTCTFDADGQPVTVSTNTTGAEPLRVVFKASNTPGWGKFTARLLNEKGRSVADRTVGVLVDPDRIEPGAPDPKDFDAFWGAQIAAMNATPMDPLIQPVQLPEGSTQRVYDVRLSCGPAIAPFTNAPANYAYLCMGMPANAKPKSLPAIVQFQGASCIGLGKHPTGMWYADCAIHVSMSPHSARNNWTKEEATDFASKLSGWGYASLRADSREDYYMRGMILRVVRTLQFVKQQPEWNGKVLFLHGESQGGFQSLVGAALDKDVTCCLAMVPAMSDHLGYIKGRRNGWPGVIKVVDGHPADAFGEAAAKVMPYYDNANFARRITCETWIATGLLDNTCPPSGVCAVYNALPAGTKKDLYLDPKAGHGTCNPAVLPRLTELIGKL